MNTHNNPFAIVRHFVLLLALSGLLTGTVYSQQSTDAAPAADSPVGQISSGEPLSKEVVRDLVSQLSDDDVRKLLIQRLDAVAAADAKTEDEGSAWQALSTGFGTYWKRLTSSLQGVPTIPSIIGKIDEAIEGSIGSYGLLLLHCVLALGAGVVAERIVAYLFRRRKQALIAASSDKLSTILRILYTRLSMDILGVMAFGIVSSIVIASHYEPGSYPHGIAAIVKMVIFAAWMAFVVCRFFFAPTRPDLRICKTTDERAMRLTVSFSLLAGYIVGAHNLFYLFLQIGNDNYGGFEYMAPLGFLMNLSMYLIAAWVIWYNRVGLSEVLTENRLRVSQVIGMETSEEQTWFARHWPKIAMALVIGKYFFVEVVIAATDVATYSTAAVYVTFVVIFLWPGVDANISLFVGKGISAAEDESESAGNARRDMQQGLLRVGRVLVVGLVLLSLGRMWGVDAMGIAQSGLGAKAASKLIEILFVVALSYILWELVTVFIGRWMAREGGEAGVAVDTEAGEDGSNSMSRVATLLPIINKTFKVLIVVMSVILILDIMGFNIGPIIAGAGVLGLAIGFGAQTLVKDIVSGMFFLADDAFRVGETIDVGGTQGAVEKISLRSLRLRHHEGLVHTIPYGEIPQVTNFSRDWAILKLRFRVPFDTDVNKVKKIFKKIGQEMLEDPVIGPDFLQPFKSQGVAEVDDNGMVVRGKFMAKPGKQYTIRKEVFVRVQKAFEAAGIPFARKQVMVHIPGLEKDTPLKDDDVKMISAAAADAVDEPPPPPPKGGLQGA
jgi:small-conductance mechanosensitive channel